MQTFNFLRENPDPATNKIYDSEYKIHPSQKTNDLKLFKKISLDLLYLKIGFK